MNNVTFSGGFHNSGEITVRAKLGNKSPDGSKFATLSAAQVKKLDRHFCGISGCTCGGHARAGNDSGAMRLVFEGI